MTREQLENIIKNAEEDKMLAEERMQNIKKEQDKRIADAKMQLKNMSSGYDRRGIEEIFWIVNSDFQAAQLIDTNHQLDNKLFENGNYMNQENAERMAKVTKLNFLLDRFSRENGWEDKLWENSDFTKYFIIKGDYLATSDCWSCKTQGTIYFTSMEIAEQAIEKFGDLLEEVM